MLSTCDWLRSLDYHTDRPPKLTAPEMISCSRDMAGAHQNLNRSHDLTTSLSGMISHLWVSTCYRQPTYQIQSLYFHSLQRYENVENGVVWVVSSSGKWQKSNAQDISIKGKGFHSLPSIGPQPDPGVQAVSPQVTISHPPGGRLPLLSVKPAVIFPATEHHRPLAGSKLYWLVTEAHRCQQLAQGCYAGFSPQVGFEPMTC